MKYYECDYYMQVAGSPVLNVRVRVRTGSSIGLPAGSLALAYCE